MQDAAPVQSDSPTLASPEKSYTAMVLGATGNVGGRIARLLIENPQCKKLVLVTRRKMAAFAHPKVTELVVTMDELEQEVARHAIEADVALAAFGIGKGSAKMSDDEVHQIEVSYPAAFGRAAKTAGVRVFALMTSVGAEAQARFKYLRVLAKKEQALQALDFEFLGVYRPGMILGNSNTPPLVGQLMPLVHWAMPAKYHSIHKNDLARTMVAQSQQAFESLTTSSRAQAASRILEFPQMRPFFVKGDCDQP